VPLSVLEQNLTVGQHQQAPAPSIAHPLGWICFGGVFDWERRWERTPLGLVVAVKGDRLFGIGSVKSTHFFVYVE